MRVFVSKRNVLQYLLIILMINLSGSYIYKTYNDMFLGISLVISFLIFIRYKLLAVNKKNYLFVILIACSCFVTSVYTKGSLSIGSVLNVFCHFFVVLTAISLNKEGFVVNYCKVIYYIGLISLFYFLLQLISPKIVIPLLPIRSGGIYYTNFFYTYVRIHSHRNCGFMTEPGLFQVPLNVALFFMLYNKDALKLKENEYKKRLLIIILIIISNQSTVGYLNAFVIIAFYMIARKNESNRRVKKLLWNGLILGVVFLIVAYFLGSTSFLNDVISKIYSNGKIDIRSDTGYYRAISMETDFRIILNNPFGVGYTKYKALFSEYKVVNSIIGSSSCGLTYFPAVFGIVNYCILLYFYISNVLRCKKWTMSSITLLIVFACTGWTQPILYYTPFVAGFYVLGMSESYPMRSRLSDY